MERWIGVRGREGGNETYLLGHLSLEGLQNTSFSTISGSVATGATLLMSLRIERINRDAIW